MPRSLDRFAGELVDFVVLLADAPPAMRIYRYPNETQAREGANEIRRCATAVSECGNRKLEQYGKRFRKIYAIRWDGNQVSFEPRNMQAHVQPFIAELKRMAEARTAPATPRDP